MTGNSIVLFAGNGNDGRNLWVTDGTPSGTSELSVAGASSFGLNPFDLTVLGGEVLFDGLDASGNNNLWVTNGTAAGTSELSVAGAFSVLLPTDLTVFGSVVLFNGIDTSGANDLWVTDGTAAGTYALAVAGTPGYGLSPDDLTVFGNEVLFNGTDANNNDNLWVTNGTAAGTSELLVAGTPAYGLSPSDLTVFGNEVLFNGVDASGNPNLWVTDGTAAGTSELSVAGASSSGLAPFDMTVFGNKVLFEGMDASGNYGFWVTDGTAAGTSELAVAGAYSGGLAPAYFTVFGSEVLFAGKDTSGHINLWVTDGTAAGISELSVAGAYTAGLDPSDLTVSGNEVLFNGLDAQGRYSLWMTNGTAAGTSELSIPSASANGLAPTDLTIFDNAPCYCRGTLIATKHGQNTVETLRIGDEVTTMSGAVRPIKWIGRRSYGGRFIMGRMDILPICIKAGALGGNMPERDLWISPNHAMYFEDEARGGELIEAKDLVNGVSIVQARPVEKVEYFHIELDSHDVIIAEGALSETFIDDDSRGMFHNAHDYDTQYGQLHTAPAYYCAPRLNEGYEVEAVRRRLALHAGFLRSTDAPCLGALRGYIDRIRASGIAGWAQNSDAPKRRSASTFTRTANGSAAYWRTAIATTSSAPGWAAAGTLSHSRHWTECFVRPMLSRCAAL
jgi:ELWxxDGT repeat protein